MKKLLLALLFVLLCLTFVTTTYAACNDKTGDCNDGSGSVQGSCCNDDYCQENSTGSFQVKFTCAPRVASGKSCTDSNFTPQGTCQSGLICTGESVDPLNPKPGTCTAAGKTGNTCTTTTDDLQGTCDSSHYCANEEYYPNPKPGTCTALVAHGGKCTGSLIRSQGTCAAGLVCSGEGFTPNETPGTCKTPAEVSAGNGTKYPQGTCGTGSICYSGNYNSDHVVPGAQCGTLTNWHWGTDFNGHVPLCTPGVGSYCCDFGNPTVNFTYQQPCVKDKNGNCTAVNTSFGNIPISVTAAISTIFGILLSFSGGIIVLIIVFAGYRIMISGGDQEKLKNAREMLTAGIVGLLFIIFSVTILQIIGVDILQIPGLGK